MAYSMISNTTTKAYKPDGHVKDKWSIVSVYRRIYVLQDKDDLAFNVEWRNDLYAKEQWVVGFKGEPTIREVLEPVLKDEWPEKVDWDTGVECVMRCCERHSSERVYDNQPIMEALDCFECGEAPLHVILKEPTCARVVPRRKRPREDNGKTNKNPSPLKRSKSWPKGFLQS